LLRIIHGATGENTLFDDGTNTFRVLNPTQIFLHLKKKLLLTRCKAWVNILAIILFCNDYF
jgi:hypothetical protein